MDQRQARIERRRLFQTGVAAGLLALTGVPLRAQTRRGRFTAALGEARVTDNWDARTHAGLFMMAAGHGAIFDCLTEIAADGSIKCELAESWEASSDARVWTFNLRKNVRFHDGQTFSADDVIASLCWHMADNVVSPARPLISPITEMRKITDHQVQFTLAAGNADFPYLMSDYHLVIYPADRLGEPVGTGLYRLKSFDPGVQMTATRVDDHYKGDSAGFFEEIRFLAMNDPLDRMNAIMTGEVDAISGIDLPTRARIKANPSLRMHDVAGNRHYTFAMPTDAPPLDQLHLRKALKYGVDRQGMVDTLLRGYGQVGRDTPIGPANQYFAKDIAAFPYDPDRARYHLRNAGLDRLQVGIADFNDVLADTMATAGIDLKTSGVPTLKFAEWSGRLTEDWMFAMGYTPAAPWNDSGWDHAQFNALMETARSELDSIKRRALYREMQVILRDEGNMLIPMFANDVHAVNNRIWSPQTIGNQWQMDNARMAERWARA
ncbi:ABC transporter substrate-binding protein [Yoonia sp. 2307UL14-13]|uniref:ABC transporter substrate-binding protein n=1 Tax=Yoonia sp. 2307UL14-13 TaxID=3126506 RepID=UPI0030A112CC